MIIADTPNKIEYFNLSRAKSAIKLESVGLKSRGGSVRKMYAIHFGLKPSASHEIVIQKIQEKMNELIQLEKQ
jgi:hypothetical protein